MTTYIASTDGGAIDGSSGNDVLIGKSGEDTLNGGTGSDILMGGAGNDLIYYDEIDIKVDGGTGIDTLVFNGSGQSLDLGLQKTVMNFERIDLEGSGGHSLRFSAADVLRTSDNDKLIIFGNQSGQVTFADAGWVYQGYNNGVSTFVNGSAIVAVDSGINVVGFSKNAILSLGSDSATSVTEDLNYDSGNMLVATGTIIVSDPNAGQALLLPTVTSVDSPHGSLTLTTGPLPGPSAGSVVYEYSYVIDNDDTQKLGATQSWTDSFTVASVDGSSMTLKFKVNGVNDPADIGMPSVSSVEEDTNVDENGKLVASGTIPISDADADAEQALFDLAGFDGSGDWGTLILQTDGSYTYTVDNSMLNSWNSNRVETDTFTVRSLDGTTANISFSAQGKNDPPNITGGTFGAVIDEMPARLNSDGTLPYDFYIANGYAVFTDIDNVIGGSFLVQLLSVDSSIGTPKASLTFDPSSNLGTVTWEVSYDGRMFDDLKAGGMKTYSYQLKITGPSDGVTTRDISVTINGANDPIVGDASANILTDTSGIDWISGLGGNDTINGLAGDDIIYGGTGDDTLNGGDGNDTINGGDGSDTINGGPGNNALIGGAGDDTYIVDVVSGLENSNIQEFASDGVDTVKVNGSFSIKLLPNIENISARQSSSNLTLEGNDGNNLIYGGNSKNQIFGGAGDDVLYGGSGDDTIFGSDGSDALFDDSGTNTLSGGEGNDYFGISGGINTVNGNNGDDKFIFKESNGIIHGDAGNDQFKFDSDWGRIGASSLSVFGDAGMDVFDIVVGDNDERPFGIRIEDFNPLEDDLRISGDIDDFTASKSFLNPDVVEIYFTPDVSTFALICTLTFPTGTLGTVGSDWLQSMVNDKALFFY